MPSGTAKARGSHRRRTERRRTGDGPGEDLAGIDVVHAIPGRARVRIDVLKGDPAVATRLRERLASLPGMRRVEANPVTGTVLLVYEAEDTRWLEELPDAAGTPAAEVAAVRSRLEREAAPAANGQPPRARVAAFFDGLNRRVQDATGGVDLALLVPALLVLLGLRALVATDKVRTPTWYDLLWFGFGTFVMLNTRGETGAIAAVEDAAD